jgi:lysyl-tRNA synthetase, class II
MSISLRHEQLHGDPANEPLLVEPLLVSDRPLERRFLELVSRTQRGRPVQAYKPSDAIRKGAVVAARIRAHRTQIHEVLSSCTTRPVIEDEILRSLDLLESLPENSPYFCGRVPFVASILPRNQLLYSLVYMAAVPGLQADHLVVRPPAIGAEIVKSLVEILDTCHLCERFEVDTSQYVEFSRRHLGRADAVLFAGTHETATKILPAVSRSAIFLANGAGHNPIVVGLGADIEAAVTSIMRVAYHNQGQDCAAPNAILVHTSILEPLQSRLREKTKSLMANYSPADAFDHPIGPNTDPEHVGSITRWLLKHQHEIVYGGEINALHNVICPTIMVRALKIGGNFRELFAPIILLQPYSRDSELGMYFERPEYRARAMYVTLFGKSEYVEDVLDKELHPVDTVLRDTDLHRHERGTLPYGGYGQLASAIVYDRARLPTPLLAQREIYRFLLAPRLAGERSTFARDNYMNLPTKNNTTHAGASRLDKLKRLDEIGCDPYPANFHASHTAHLAAEKYALLPAGDKTTDEITVAGRVYAIRNSGMFVDLRDASGKIQIYSDEGVTEPLSRQILECIDIGDFIGVTGAVRRTKRGELTVDARRMVMLSKALLPLPDKFHGLADVETRYRQRYLDFAANAESREVIRLRSKIISKIRTFLVGNDFLEVETPMLHPIYGGAAARPFTTYHNTLQTSLYLRIAPELYLKRMLIGGIADRLFEINRNFRNEGISTRHNPEFTMLEAYQAYANASDMMNLLEGLIGSVCDDLFGKTELPFKEREISFKAPFRRLNMIESVSTLAGVDFLTVKSDEAAKGLGIRLGLSLEGNETWGEVIAAIFETKIEPTLFQPTHVTHFPTDISPLAKASPEDPRIAERFETYVNSWEIANAFSELNDPREQRARFVEQTAQAHSRGELDRELDEDFLTAMEHGMPPAAGLGIGIDRLIMLLTNSDSIREVIAFPTLRERRSG